MSYLFTGNLACDLKGCGFVGGIADGGIIPGSSTTVVNCILWGNFPDEGGGHTVLYSNVRGGFPGPGNIDADPLFVDPDNGDFRLQAGSPSIDAGHNWAIAGITDVDLDGNPRIVHAAVDLHPGCGIPAIVDMGAYEYSDGTAVDILLGDIDGTGDVSPIDLGILFKGWGRCKAGCCLADLDLDTNVGILDLFILFENWSDAVPGYSAPRPPVKRRGVPRRQEGPTRLR